MNTDRGRRLAVRAYLAAYAHEHGDFTEPELEAAAAVWAEAERRWKCQPSVLSSSHGGDGGMTECIPGYSFGMTTKIAISLPDEQVEAAKQAVADGRAASVSAYVSDALAQAQRHDTLAELVADMRAEDGAPGEEDYAWARRALGQE